VFSGVYFVRLKTFVSGTHSSAALLHASQDVMGKQSENALETWTCTILTISAKIRGTRRSERSAL
jgi:hypothetical protein